MPSFITLGSSPGKGYALEANSQYWALFLNNYGSNTQEFYTGVGNSGNIYANGVTSSGGATFRISPLGAVSWQKNTAAVTSFSVGTSLGQITDSSDNTYIVTRNGVNGSFIILFKFLSSGSLSFSMGTYTAYTSSNPVLDSSGNVWSATSGTSLTDSNINQYSPSTGVVSNSFSIGGGLGAYVQPLGIGIDSSDNIYYVSKYDDNSGSGLFGTNFLKMSSSGTILFSKRYYDGVSYAVSPTGNPSIVVDSAGNSYILIASSAVGQSAIYIQKANSSGTIQWLVTIYDSTLSIILYPSAIAYDSVNSFIYVAGYTSSSQSIYLFKLNTSGTLIWQRKITFVSGGTFLNLTSLSVDSTNGALIVSYYPGQTSPYNQIILRLPPDGSHTGNFTLSSYVFNYGVSADFTSSVSGTGFVTSSVTFTSSAGSLGNTGAGFSPTSASFTQVNTAV
jgi:hypothetical protein